MSFAEDSKNTYFTKTDLLGNYTYVSPLFIEIFNLHPEDIYGTSSLDTIYFEDHSICFETVQKCFMNPKTYQKVIMRKPVDDKKIIWTKWEFYLDTDKDGNPLEMLCYGQNITDLIELKQLVKDYSVQFKENETKFKTLFETSSLFIVLHTAKGKILEANQAFCDHIGINKDLISKHNLLKFTEAKNHKEFKSFINKKIVGLGEISLETEITNKDGLITPVSINPRAFHNEKGEIFIWTIAKDITERKNQEQELKKQKELLEQTAIIAKLGGWEIYLDPYKREWTKEVYTIFDLDPEITDSLDNSINFYHPDDQTILTAAQSLCIKEGTLYDLELRLISAKKVNKWVRVMGKANYLNNEIKSIRGTVQDITDKKNVEETLKKQNDLVKDLYFTQSHLIRLPIANIIGLTDLLEVTNQQDEKDEILSKIKDSVIQLDKIIKEVANKKLSD